VDGLGLDCALLAFNVGYFVVFYVMDKAIHLPLRIHFIFPSQGEFIHPFIHRDIAKNWLYRTESFALFVEKSAVVRRCCLFSFASYQ